MFTIDKVPTRKLLDTYKSSRYRMDDNIYMSFQLVVKGGVILESKFSIAQIKEELDNREHIPSKQEGKILRRLMSKNKMSEDEVKRRFKIVDEYELINR